jgi:hypothetical protein
MGAEVANEVFYSGLGDARLTETLAANIVILLSDQSMIHNHPALTYVGDARGSGSTTRKIAAFGLDGYDLLASVAENASVANTALTDDSYTVTVARYAKQYQHSDLAKMTDSVGHLNPEVLARDAVMSVTSTLTSLIANVVDDFTATVGSTGVNFSVSDFFDAMATLEAANVKGPFLSLLHPVQFGDLKNSLRSETGPLQLVPASAELMRLRGDSYKGEFLGCDIITSTQVPTANSGADRAGGMWGANAVMWGDSSIEPEPSADAVFAGRVMIERERDASAALTKVITNYYLGVIGGTNALDAAGVSIITDA